MKNKKKQSKLIYFYNKNRKFNNYSKDNKNLNLINNLNSINSNNNLSNINLIDFNKNNIKLINEIKKKANYFNLNEKKKQNKELIKVKTISEKLSKTLKFKNIEKKRQIFNSESISNTKLLNIYLKALKFLNYDLVSYIKSNSFNSNFFNKKIENLNFQNQIERKKNILKQVNLKLIDFNQEKKLKENIYENNDFVNVTNKHKSSILLFIDNLKNKKSDKSLVNFNSKNYFLNKEKNNLIIQQNIRKYINSKFTFNSQIIKNLATSNNYSFNKYNQINNLIKNNIYEFLYRSFISMFSIISKPIYIIKSNKIIIQFYYLIFKKELSNKNNTKSKLILENNNKLKIICNILTRFFKKPIELELVRLYYPYYNSNILVNLFGIYINKIQLRKIINKFIGKAVKKQSLNNNLFKKNYLPSELSGIKIKVAGRLLTQRVVPRKTVKIINRGALSKDKAIFVETARYTNKNKRGAFSITISIAHKLRNS